MTTAKTPAISGAAAMKAIERLRAALRKNGRADLAASLVIDSKRGCLCAADANKVPVCRLRCTGAMGDGDLQRFKGSTERHDTGNDFMFGGSTLEECTHAAIGRHPL